MKIRTALIPSVIALAVSMASQAHAQDENGNDAASSGDTTVEILVTAQRREERLIDVPTSIAVTDGDTLVRLNLTKADDLVFTTPGLALGDSNTPRGAGLRVRGVGTAVFADGIEQSVGTVVDGVPYARAGQGLADLVDVERIEVLRGPQGLLFGRNASAGLINVTTKRPTSDFTALGNFSYGTYDEVLASGSMSGPISDTIRARVTGYLNSANGIVSNLTTDETYNNRREYGFRGQIDFAPSNDFEIILRGDWSERDNRASIWTVRRFADATTDPRPGIAFLKNVTGGIEEGPRADVVNPGGVIANRMENYGGSVEANLFLGDYTLTSQTAYREWSQADNNDADLSPLNILDRNFGGNDLWQFSQELRLTSPTGGPVEFVGGLMYYRSSNSGSFSQVGRFTIGLAGPQAAGINIPLAPGLVLPAAQNFGRDVETDIDVEDYGVFGQATVKLSDALSLVGGARLIHTQVSIDYERAGTPGANAFNFVLGAAFAPLTFAASQNDTALAWRAGLQYQPDRNLNLFASVSRGYKGPGYNNLLDLVIPAGATPANFTAVAPEIPTNYEIGIKYATDSGSFSGSLTAFRTEFRDFQAQVVEFAPGSSIGSFAIRNAGELVSQGFELELLARPVAGLSLGFGLAYTDAAFDSFTSASCPRLGALVTTVGAPCGPLVAGGRNTTSFDASGLAVNNAPRVTGNASASYDFTISEASGIGGFVQTLYYFRSDTVFGLYPKNIANPTAQDGFGIFNATAGVTFDNERITLAVWGRNLFDRNFVTSIFDLPFDGAGGLAQFLTRDASRTLGVRVGINF